MPRSTDLKVLGKRIADARSAVGLTQRSLASEIGVHAVTVADWERGKAEPTMSHLQAVAVRTGKTLDFFSSEGTTP